MNMFPYLMWSVLLIPFAVAIRPPGFWLTGQRWMKKLLSLVNPLQQLEK